MQTSYPWMLLRLIGVTVGIFILFSVTRSFREVTSIPALAQAQHVHFADIGDFGLAGPLEAGVANLVKSWDPEFIITNGDDNYQLGGADTIDENIGQYYHDYIFPYKGIYGAGATENRFWPALGDHDWKSLACTGSTCTGPYFDYFTLPGNERYYDIVKGPVHIFFLDNNNTEPDGYTSTSIQAKWLQAQLAAATEPWKIVITQQPPYSSGSMHGSVSAARWPFKAWGASLVISGNEHNYERFLIDGMPYIVNGAGGVSLYGFGTPLPGSEVRYNGDYGALLMDADEQSLTMQFITSAGTVIDTYTMNKAATGTPSPTGTVSPISTASPTGTPSPTDIPPINTPTPTNTPTTTPVIAGLSYKYYEGTWSTVPDFSEETPLKTGIVDNFILTPNSSANQFAFQWMGCLNITSTDTYTFSIAITNSNTVTSSSQLYLDGHEVVHKNSNATEEQAGSTSLTAGLHAIALTYFQDSAGSGQPGNEAKLAVRYASPTLAKQKIPNDLLTYGNCSSLLPPSNKTYRYVRFVAESEVNGNFWATMAELDLLDGTGSALNKATWHMTYADSEEFANGEGYAPFAIDNDRYTYWRTEYVAVHASFPHEFRIDLGANYTLSAFRYLPRQDSDSGRIAKYKFYGSQDGVKWGEPLAQGIFPNTANVQIVNFSALIEPHIFLPLVRFTKPS